MVVQGRERGFLCAVLVDGSFDERIVNEHFALCACEHQRRSAGAIAQEAPFLRKADEVPICKCWLTYVQRHHGKTTPKTGGFERSSRQEVDACSQNPHVGLRIGAQEVARKLCMPGYWKILSSLDAHTSVTP